MRISWIIFLVSFVLGNERITLKRLFPNYTSKYIKVGDIFQCTNKVMLGKSSGNWQPIAIQLDLY